MAIKIKLDDLLHDRRMTLTELADRSGIAVAAIPIPTSSFCLHTFFAPAWRHSAL